MPRSPSAAPYLHASLIPARAELANRVHEICKSAGGVAARLTAADPQTQQQTSGLGRPRSPDDRRPPATVACLTPASRSRSAAVGSAAWRLGDLPAGSQAVRRSEHA